MTATESDGLLGGSPATERKSNRAWVWVAVILLSIIGGAVAGVASVLALKSSGDRPESTSTSDLVQHAVGSKYKATQLISFTINTLGGLDAHGECKGHHVDENGVCYLGDTKNITEDVRHRLKIVEKVLDRLKDDTYVESPHIDHSGDVLKIFMMPEFFWRGPYGAYKSTDLFDGGILELVADHVRELVQPDYFQDYLFVFGTVIAVRAPEDARKSDEHVLDPSELQYYNYAPVIKGGKGGNRYLVTKRYISAVDFLNREKLPNPRKFDHHEYGDVPDRAKELIAGHNDKLVQDNYIEMDGLRIGIEVCLDHRMGALWDNLKTKHNSELVDIQLVTSAGMAIERGPNPVVPGGVVYLSDGEASSAACIRTDDGTFDPENVCRQDVAGLKRVPIGGVGYSDFFPLAACIDVEKIDFLTGYYSLYQTQGCAYTLKNYGINVMEKFTSYPPSIEIYPTVPLPGYGSR